MYGTSLVENELENKAITHLMYTITEDVWVAYCFLRKLDTLKKFSKPLPLTDLTVKILARLETGGEDFPVGRVFEPIISEVDRIGDGFHNGLEAMQIEWESTRFLSIDNDSFEFTERLVEEP